MGYSEKVAGDIDDEVKALIGSAYAHCSQLLQEHKKEFDAVVEYLLEHESMTGAQFDACMKGEMVAEASETALFDGFEQTEE